LSVRSARWTRDVSPVGSMKCQHSGHQCWVKCLLALSDVETPALSPSGERVWRLAIFSDVSRVRILCPLPLGGEGGPPPAFSSAGAGRVRGSRACARPFAAHNSPVKAFDTDPLTPRPLSPKRERGEANEESAPSRFRPGAPTAASIYSRGVSYKSTGMAAPPGTSVMKRI